MERFLSAVSFHWEESLEVVNVAGAGWPGEMDRPVAVSTRSGDIRHLHEAPRELVVDGDERLTRVMAYYRDAEATASPFYRFLAFFNALDVACEDFDGGLAAWVRQAFRRSDLGGRRATTDNPHVRVARNENVVGFCVAWSVLTIGLGCGGGDSELAKAERFIQQTYTGYEISCVSVGVRGDRHVWRCTGGGREECFSTRNVGNGESVNWVRPSRGKDLLKGCPPAQPKATPPTSEPGPILTAGPEVTVRDKAGDPEDGNYKRYPGRADIDIRRVSVKRLRGGSLRLTVQTAAPARRGNIYSFHYFGRNDNDGGLIQVRYRDDGTITGDASVEATNYVNQLPAGSARVSGNQLVLTVPHRYLDPLRRFTWWVIAGSSITDALEVDDWAPDQPENTPIDVNTATYP